MNPCFSVVIPAFNEECRLGRSLEALSQYFDSRGDSYEIILVDDGSSDGTAHTAKAWSQRLGEGRLYILQHPNRGKGFSVKRGMLEARGRYGLICDADLSTPIAELERLEEEIEDGAHIAFASRDVPGAQVEVRQSLIRETAGRGFNRIVRGLTGLPYRDTQCGFKLFDLMACRRVFELQRLDGFGFDVEVLYIARKKGLRLAEVPVRWRNAPGSKVGLLSGLRAGMDLLTILRNDRRGLYDD